jgi:hypothetical protein
MEKGTPVLLVKGLPMNPTWNRAEPTLARLAARSLFERKSVPPRQPGGGAWRRRKAADAHDGLGMRAWLMLGLSAGTS